MLYSARMSHIPLHLSSGSIRCATLQACAGCVPRVVLSEGKSAEQECLFGLGEALILGGLG